jgi:hypothetical protein
MKTLPGSTSQRQPKAEESSTTTDDDKSSYNNVINQIILKNQQRNHRQRAYPNIQADLVYSSGGLMGNASGTRTPLYK